jgi:hypothetical protein
MTGITYFEQKLVPKTLTPYTCSQFPRVGGVFPVYNIAPRKRITRPGAGVNRLGKRVGANKGQSLAETQF